MRAITKISLDDITFDINKPSSDNTVTNTTSSIPIVTEAPVSVDPTIISEPHMYSDTSSLMSKFTGQNPYNNQNEPLTPDTTAPTTDVANATTIPTTDVATTDVANTTNVATTTPTTDVANATTTPTTDVANATTTPTTDVANATTQAMGSVATNVAGAVSAATNKVAQATQAAQTEIANAKNPYEAIFNKIKRDESKGNYGAFGDIGDGAGITAGAYQFTEKSGKLAKLARMLGIDTRKTSRKVWLSKLKKKLNTPEGIKAQDTLFYNSYAKPAIKIAKKYNIKDTRIIHFLIDTNVNGGLHNVVSRAKRMGGLTLANLKKARIARYRYLASKNPRYKKFLRGWINRVKRI